MYQELFSLCQIPGYYWSWKVARQNSITQQLTISTTRRIIGKVDRYVLHFTFQYQVTFRLLTEKWRALTPKKVVFFFALPIFITWEAKRNWGGRNANVPLWLPILLRYKMRRALGLLTIDGILSGQDTRRAASFGNQKLCREDPSSSNCGWARRVITLRHIYVDWSTQM